MIKEKWLPVVGYEGIYEVSDLGRLRSVDRVDAKGANRKGKLLQPGLTDAGYARANLSKNAVSKAKMVHVLVLEAHVGPAPQGMEACHSDGVSWNNALENLRWDTPAANYADKIRVGTCNRGARNGNGKLKPDDIPVIRGLLAQRVSRSKIARRYGVSPVAITDIHTGRTWSHI